MRAPLSRQILPSLYPNVPFLNVDEIQREAFDFGHPVAAGKEFLQRLDGLESRRESFALETTLSSPMYAKKIRRWRNLGYRASLHFIELPSEESAVQRVAERVAAGGHSVLEADIRRRLHRGKTLLETLYKPIVDEWYHWISDEQGLRLAQHHER